MSYAITTNGRGQQSSSAIQTLHGSLVSYTQNTSSLYTSTSTTSGERMAETAAQRSFTNFEMRDQHGSIQASKLSRAADQAARTITEGVDSAKKLLDALMEAYAQCVRDCLEDPTNSVKLQAKARALEELETYTKVHVKIVDAVVTTAQAPVRAQAESSHLAMSALAESHQGILKDTQTMMSIVTAAAANAREERESHHSMQLAGQEQGFSQTLRSVDMVGTQMLQADNQRHQQAIANQTLHLEERRTDASIAREEDNSRRQDRALDSEISYKQQAQEAEIAYRQQAQQAQIEGEMQRLAIEQANAASAREIASAASSREDFIVVAGWNQANKKRAPRKAKAIEPAPGQVQVEEISESEAAKK